MILNWPKFKKIIEVSEVSFPLDNMENYIAGLTNRLLAFERLLEEHPEYMEHVLLMQIAVPSRTDVKEYQDLKEHIDKLVGMINGKFSTSHWSPIRYIYGQVSQVRIFVDLYYNT